MLRFIFNNFWLFLVFLLVACESPDDKKNRDIHDKPNITKIFLSKDKGLNKDIVEQITSALKKQCPNIIFDTNSSALDDHLRIQLATHDLDDESTKYLDDLAQKSALNRMVILVFYNYDRGERRRWDGLLGQYGDQLKFAGLTANTISKPEIIKNIISRLDLCKL